MIAVGVAVGAAVGAAIRSHLSPVGWRATLAVNLVGSLILGFLTGWDPSPDVLRVVGTGFCGALTTFATFAFEASAGRPSRRMTIIACNVVGCVALAFVGHAIGAA